MLQSARALQGFVIRATDGKIGHVEEFYFDDEHWTVRYLVVNCGSWLIGRRVLIASTAVTGVDPRHHAIAVNLTRAQVEAAPDLDTAQPITRSQEASYLGYYGWPIYWSGGLAWGAAAYPGLIMAPPSHMIEEQITETSTSEEKEPEERSHLRSTREVTGYAVMARDGEIGHVEDFILDDSLWSIRYLAVDTKNFWPGNPVLIPPQWLASVAWPVGRVRVDHTRSEIENAPEWDPSRPLSREYEEALHRHYQRPSFWNVPEPSADPTEQDAEESDHSSFVFPPA